MSILWESENYA